MCSSDVHLFKKSAPLPAEPDFVGSALVREGSGSHDGDDDKIYFFFSERALELDCDTELTVARVARVCKVMPRKRIGTGLLRKLAKRPPPVIGAVDTKLPFSANRICTQASMGIHRLNPR